MKMKLILLLSLLALVSCDTMRLPEHDRKIYQLIGEFAKKKQKDGLSAGGFGGGIDHSTGKSNLISIDFCTDEVLYLDRARQLSVEVTREFLNLINGKEEYREELAEFPFPVKYVDIGIIGGTPSSFDPSYISTITIAFGKIFYYTQKPSPDDVGLTKVHEETFEEAEQILREQEANAETPEAAA